jgi:hypothetical protein
MSDSHEEKEARVMAKEMVKADRANVQSLVLILLSRVKEPTTALSKQAKRCTAEKKTRSMD